MARNQASEARGTFGQLRRFSIFAGLRDEQLQRLWGILELRQCPADEVIVQEGETGDALYLVLDGEVEVSKTLTLMVARGNVEARDKALDRMWAAQAPFFGEVALLGSDHQRTATVKTVTRCTLGVLRRSRCLVLCEQDPKLGFSLMRNIASALATRLDKANRDILKLTTAFSLALQE